MKWITLIEPFADRFTRPNPPATEAQIAEAENKLGAKLPGDLKALLLEMDGDNNLLFSTEQIINTNIEVRELGCFMPLDCLLFFGGNGCGDYFGYPITKDDGVRDDNVFMWEHEYDNRVYNFCRKSQQRATYTV